MAKISKDRGKRFEQEVVRLFKDWGHRAFRTAQYMGKTGQAPDVKVKGLHVECKRRRQATVYQWYEQAVADSLAGGKGDIPVVIFRADGKPPMAMMHFEDFMKFYNEWVAGYEENNTGNDTVDENIEN